ncbi:MAG: ATP-binding protein [Bacteroidota bacterium]|nr:ATP-binding protein [Bacteroidota bacterium]MDE2832998.1 ATP-binding protein [Bacteroidota bacterium]MDE2957746.1 ATP-binding protein [Bacteroidota bacterium]
MADIVTVALIGAESTGKTALATALARHFDTEWVPEYLRIFVDHFQRVPREQEIPIIALGQLRLVAARLAETRRVLFLDTDLVTTCVYQRKYFGSCPAQIEQMASDFRADLYLFTQPDIPWEPDGIQRSSPEERDVVHELLLQELDHLELPRVLVSGNWDQRFAMARRAVRALLKSRRHHPVGKRVTP